MTPFIDKTTELNATSTPVPQPSCVSVAAHAISNPSSRMKFIERYNVAMTLHLFAVIRALKHRVKHPLSPRRGTRLGVIHGDGYPNGVILSYKGCCFS